MDRAALVDADVEMGRKLIAALLAGGLPIASAMWLRQRGSTVWQLFIASPDVEKHGPRVVYKFVQKIAGSLGIDLGIDRVAVVNTTNHFSNEIASYARNLSDALYLVDITIGDREIHEALIYPIIRRAKASQIPPRADQAAIRKARQAA
jgi:hypothetical protein